jgi:pantoate--beta-alanine ligase
MAERLCGARRPGHFRGVLTVVAKLFGLMRPDVAVFGRKDFQQAVLVRQMVRDLELGVEIEIGPIVREDDGLALSSRNSYLSPEERGDAVGLSRGLRAALRAFREGARSAEALREAVRREVEPRTHLELEYAALVDPDDLEPVDPAREGAVLVAAAHCGGTCLIDNVYLALG